MIIIIIIYRAPNFLCACVDAYEYDGMRLLGRPEFSCTGGSSNAAGPLRKVVNCL